MSNLTKLLFFDIETVGMTRTLGDLEKMNPVLAEQVKKYEDWFYKRFPEDKDIGLSEVFERRSALVPEFAKVITISFGFLNEDGTVKMKTIANDDEKTVLQKSRQIFEKVNDLDYILCGHNIKNFDIPMLAKRMMVHGMEPPAIFPSYDTKPWDVKALDVREVWSYGNLYFPSSLDLICASLGIQSSKDGDVKGDNVHYSYWEGKKLKEIADYCEKDVECTIEIVKKINNLK